MNKEERIDFGMVDMHCHIIPGVDDGPSEKEEVRQMLQQEYDDGVRTIIMTPHYRKGRFEAEEQKVMKRALYVWQEAQDMGLEMNIFLGCEYHANSDIIEDIKNNERFRMEGGKYVLVEFSSSHTFTQVRNWIYQMISSGFRPIIAHVERYPNVVKKLEQVKELVQLGAKIQVSSGAILGEHGLKLKWIAWKLLNEDLVHFVASDAHDAKSRKPNLKKCFELVTKKLGRSYARELFEKNPAKILE